MPLPVAERCFRRCAGFSCGLFGNFWIVPDAVADLRVDLLGAADGALDGTLVNASFSRRILAKRQIVVLPLLAPNVLIAAVTASFRFRSPPLVDLFPLEQVFALFKFSQVGAAVSVLAARVFDKGSLVRMARLGYLVA